MARKYTPHEEGLDSYIFYYLDTGSSYSLPHCPCSFACAISYAYGKTLLYSSLSNPASAGVEIFFLFFCQNLDSFDVCTEYCTYIHTTSTPSIYTSIYCCILINDIQEGFGRGSEAVRPHYPIKDPVPSVNNLAGTYEYSRGPYRNSSSICTSTGAAFSEGRTDPESESPRV